MLGPKSRRSALFPIVSVGLAMISFVLIKTAGDAVFLSTQGLPELSLAFICISAVSVPAAMVHITAIRRLGMRRVRMGVLVLAGLGFLFSAPFVGAPRSWMPAVLFVLVPIAFSAVFAALWLLAADLL